MGKFFFQFLGLYKVGPCLKVRVPKNYADNRKITVAFVVEIHCTFDQLSMSYT